MANTSIKTAFERMWIHVVNALSNKSDVSHKHTAAEVGADSAGSASSALSSAKSYADTKVSGLASTSVVDNKISTHNTSASAHSDIRTLISDLTTKLNNFLDIDDTTTDQLSEVITLINNNKGTLESLTTSKINVSDIVNDLTTNSTSKVISAAQGVAINALIDALQTEVDTKADKHDHPYLSTSTTYAASDSVGGSATSANKMNVTRVTSSITDIAASMPIKSETIYFGGGDAVSYGCPSTYCIVNIKRGENYRTLLDCYNLNTGDHYINGCMDTRDTTSNPWTGWILQPNASHTHDDIYYTESEIDTKLSSKSDSSHTHPTDTTRAAQTDLDAHTGDTTVHITAAERTAWNAVETNSKAYTDEQVATKTVVQIVTWEADD